MGTVLVFHHCDKTNFKKERFILAHGFRGFSPKLLGYVVSGSVGRQTIMGKSMW
jgi:hypothetical protein